MSRVQTKCGLKGKMQKIDQIEEEGKEKKTLGRHDRNLPKSLSKPWGNDLTIVEAVHEDS